MQLIQWIIPLITEFCFALDFLVMDWSPTWMVKAGARDVEY